MTAQTAPRLTARDFHPDLLPLYDGYVHGRLSRRDFLDRAVRPSPSAA